MAININTACMTTEGTLIHNIAGSGTIMTDQLLL